MFLPVFNDPGMVDLAVQPPPGWGVDNGTLTFVPDDTAPGSGGGCLRWTNAVDTGGVFPNQVTLPVNTPVVISMAVKNLPGGNNDCLIQIRDSGFSSVAFAEKIITGAWARYELAFTTHATLPVHNVYFMGWAGSGFDLLTDAWQMERDVAAASPYMEVGFVGAPTIREHTKFGPF